jgi:hypothetical protein
MMPSATTQFHEIYYLPIVSYSPVKMSLHYPTYLLLAMTLAVIVLVVRRRVIFRRHSQRITDFPTAIAFLKKTNLESRAKANTHLRHAFGIMNPFVSKDQSFHDIYIQRVQHRLHGPSTNWSTVVTSAQVAAEQLHNMTTPEEIRVGIRMVVMSVALHIIGVTEFSSSEVIRVGEIINVIWIRAKTGDETSLLQKEVYAILRQWKSDSFIRGLAGISDVTTERAILSILIPAYETMYRVVLPMVYHTHKRISFERFVTPNVSIAELRSTTEEGYTFLTLIRETLRLYPVVKRIKRSMELGDVAVDVEAIHLSGWECPEEFIPSRWMGGGDRGGFMPFGSGRGRCVANERIVGMIVCIGLGVLQNRIPDLEEEVLRELLSNDRGK